jgi:hypothetical protein
MLANSTNLQHLIALPATDTGDAGEKIEAKKKGKERYELFESFVFVR